MPILEKKPLRVAVLGYYGFDNLGDEAVLAGIRTALASESGLGETDLLVLSGNPDATTRLHPGVRAVNRWRWREVSDALRGTDLFILGGGSLLQDSTSARSLFWYAFMSVLARRRSEYFLWWGQGIGPLRRRGSRMAVRQIASSADAITVRDNDSLQLLKAIGVKGSIKMVADPAFAIQPAISTFYPNSPILIALRSWRENVIRTAFPGSSLREGFAGFGGEKNSNDNLILAPMHLPEDEDFMRGFLGQEATVLNWQKQEKTPAQVMGDFAGAQMVIAMRLHALIFAARCAVPFVAISYDPKVDALAHAAGQGDMLIPIQSIIPEAFFAKVEELRDTRATRRLRLQEFAQQQEKLARIPAQMAAELLFQRQ